jgi:hypothetical protein
MGKRFSSLMLLVLIALLALLPTGAFAFTLPTTGFGFELYDVVVNDGIKGPLGTMAGVVAMVIGAGAAISNKIMAAVPCVVGGGAILMADSLLEGMGLTF